MNHPLVDICEIYVAQHGNKKNGDIKRLSNFLNITWVKERWFVLILLSIIVIAYEKRENDKHINEERRKEEIHQAQLKRIEKED